MLHKDSSNRLPVQGITGTHLGAAHESHTRPISSTPHLMFVDDNMAAAHPQTD